MAWEANMEHIHNNSINILQHTGVVFDHEDIILLLQNRGIKIEGNRAFFNEEQIMHWIGKTPQSFEIHARSPRFNMKIGGSNVECGPAYGSSMITDWDGTVRKGMLSDYLTFLKLFHVSEYFNINGGILVQPSDVAASHSLPIMLLATILHSDKCILAGTGSRKETETAMTLLEILFGGEGSLKEKPRVTTIVNTTTPLQYHSLALDTMLLYGKHRQPVMITPAVMAGSTGPVTLAGTISLANAETLAGIAVSQMISEGTPVMYGSQSTVSDMKTVSFATGSPESAICAAYASRLAKHYGLPCRGGGTLNDAKKVSVQSGYESMMLFFVAYQEKINLILHSAGSLDSHSSMSYEQLMIDMEIIGMVKKWADGLTVNEETLALDTINQVGPGGHYLDSEHTWKNFKTVSWLPEISLRGPLHDQEADMVLLKNIITKKERMLDEYIKPELPEGTLSEMKKMLLKDGIDATEVFKP